MSSVSTMPTSTVNWLWIGNVPRIDATLSWRSAALLQVTRRVIYLEEGDVVDLQLGKHWISHVDASGVFKPVTREVRTVQAHTGAAELGPYRHYMQKEIFEQPKAIADTLEGVAGFDADLFGPKAGEVRIAIKAASLNFPDLLMLKGEYQFKPAPPFTVGMDLAFTQGRARVAGDVGPVYRVVQRLVPVPVQPLGRERLVEGGHVGHFGIGQGAVDVEDQGLQHGGAFR